jgi:MYXO-CTERM domain-containing protein
MMHRRSRWSGLPAWSLALLPALLVLGRASVSRAQIGSGWTEFTPMKSIQLRGAGARYTNENGIETFSTQPGDERAEARIEDDHRTGTWQFEGWVNVKAGVNGGCVHQVFKFLMIVAYPDGGGELRQHSYQRLQATGIYDRWVRVNTIHDPDAGRADVYIDGTWRGMVPSASPGPNGWYHKYGIYNSSGTRPVVQWRNVRFWKDGKGDMNAQASDAGVPAADARADVQVVEVGFGGVGGSGATGGAAPDASTSVPPADARVPSGGRGGSAPAGTGGSPGGAVPDPAAPGCSCRVGDPGRAPAGGSLIPAALVLTALARIARRRRPARRGNDANYL